MQILSVKKIFLSIFEINVNVLQSTITLPTGYLPWLQLVTNQMQSSGNFRPISGLLSHLTAAYFYTVSELNRFIVYMKLVKIKWTWNNAITSCLNTTNKYGELAYLLDGNLSPLHQLKYKQFFLGQERSQALNYSILAVLYQLVRLWQ